MDKIKFNCPSCQAKLKVPEKLAGVAGPCPKCGGTIVAPLTSQPEPEPVKEEPKVAAAPKAESKPAPAPAMASAPVPAPSVAVHKTPAPAAQPSVSVAAHSETSSAAVAVVERPLQSPAREVRPPNIYQGEETSQEKPAPVSQPAPIPEPAPQPSGVPPQVQPEAAQPTGFPRPLEEVSPTAAVALANSPVSHQPVVQPQPQVQNQSAAQANPQISPHANPAPAPGRQVAPAHAQSPQYQTAAAPAKNQNHAIPRTQPIVTKKRNSAEVPGQTSAANQIEVSEENGPRLDVGLAESGGSKLSDQFSQKAAEPTVINLPEVGHPENQGDFSINPPQPKARPTRAPYRPPNPVALTPPNQPGAPNGGNGDTSNLQPQVAEAPADTPPPPPESDIEPTDEQLPSSGEGSVAAFLAEAMESGPVAETTAEPPREKSKDEILDELLGVAPKSKKKKKGTSKAAVFMLSILGAVAVCAAIGAYYAFEKLGGFTMLEDDVHGPGKDEFERRQNLSGYKLPNGDVGTPAEIEVANAAIEEPSTDLGSEIIPGEIEIPTVDEASTPPDSIDAKIEEIVNSPELTEAMSDQTGIGLEPSLDSPEPPGTVAEEPVDIGATEKPEETMALTETPAVPEPPSPAIADAIEADNHAAALPAPPSSRNYSPKPYYPAPGPNDPHLHNTRELIDAFLRAPNWEARIPYIYRGKYGRQVIGNYYKDWPDQSYDRYKMKLFQWEREPEYGGPFWVYSITKSDADSDGFPVIVRVEDGNLKVDWEIYAEFSDQHFVKFCEGKIGHPHSFRLVAEQVTDYSGPDRPGFTDVKDYYCFEINPPYGGYRAYSEYAFVKKGTPLGEKLNGMIGIGEEPLAVILMLDRQDFSHGIKHYVITDVIKEGWFK